MDLRVKGHLNEKHLNIYLIELLNQIGCEYMLEACFQNIYSIYLNGRMTFTAKEIQETNIDFLCSLDNILDNVKYQSNSIQKLNYSHSFTVNNMMSFCKEICRVFVAELSKKIIKKETPENYCPFVYIIEKTLIEENTLGLENLVLEDKEKKNSTREEEKQKGISSEENVNSVKKPACNYSKYVIFKEFEEMEKYFNTIYASNPDRFILESPQISIFLSSFCILKNSNFSKDIEECEFDISKLRNFDPIELSTNLSHKYRTARNFFFKSTVVLGKMIVNSYNLNSEVLSNINNLLQTMEDWSLQRSAIYKHITLQKMGFYEYKIPLRRKNLNKIENDFINSLNQMHNPYVNPPGKVRINPYAPVKKKQKEEEKRDEEILETEKNTTVTNAIINRVENLFPVKENYEGYKFQDFFKKVSFFIIIWRKFYSNNIILFYKLKIIDLKKITK